VLTHLVRTTISYEGLGNRRDTPTATIGLAGTNHTASIYGTIVFDLTFFNEVTNSDDTLEYIEASVIDSCIEVIIGLSDIRKNRLIHRIPSIIP